jgi:hypothetical protein
MNMDTAAKLGSYIARGPVFVPKRLNKHPGPNQAASFQETQITSPIYIFFVFWSLMHCKRSSLSDSPRQMLQLIL